MSEAAAQRGFWRARVDANGIETTTTTTTTTKKRLEKKKRSHSYRVRRLFYVKCQQHKYFVSLFVPFCKKTMGEKREKKKKKRGGGSVVSDVCL